MFQFRRFPSYTYVFSIWYYGIAIVGFPIRKSAGRSLCAAHRSLSQLVTSFFGSWCQGIPLALFLAWPMSPHPPRRCSFPPVQTLFVGLWIENAWSHFLASSRQLFKNNLILVLLAFRIMQAHKEVFFQNCNCYPFFVHNYLFFNLQSLPRVCASLLPCFCLFCHIVQFSRCNLLFFKRKVNKRNLVRLCRI